MADSWEDELDAPAPAAPAVVDAAPSASAAAPAPAAAASTPAASAAAPKKVDAKKLVLGGGGAAKKAAPAAANRKLTAEEEKERVEREIADSEADLAGDLFGVAAPKKERFSADDAFDFDDDEHAEAGSSSCGSGTVLEQVSFKTVDDATRLAELVANVVREKTLKRDNVLMAFIKEFTRVAVDTLKIDDVNAVKDHVTTLYNNKKTAKVQSKAAATAGKAAAASSKKAGKINMYDAYGAEETSGRGAMGGQLSKDADDYDFM